MKTKWVILLAFSFALLVLPSALAQYTGGEGGGSEMVESAEDSSLPVTLSSFTAQAEGSTVTLRWRTETEVGNLGFSIYRSEDKNGNYTEIDFVEGAGNSGSPIDYQFTDKKVEQSKTYFYYLEDVDLTGKRGKSFLIKVVMPFAKPVKFALLQNFPNPFNPETWLPYQLPQDAPVTIRIYNVKGQLVRSINLGQQKAGFYLSKDKSTYWDGRNSLGERVAGGIYFYTLRAGKFAATRRMVIVK